MKLRRYLNEITSTYYRVYTTDDDGKYDSKSDLLDTITIKGNPTEDSIFKALLKAKIIKNNNMMDFDIATDDINDIWIYPSNKDNTLYRVVR
jgi:hypothetical protein